MGGPWKHRLSDVSDNEQTATCAECGPDTRIRFRRTQKRWVCTNQGKHHKYRGDRKKQARARLLEECVKAQGGKCAICNQKRTLVLDHCHKTEFVRSALCRGCNVGLGHFRDNPELLRKAAEYVENFAATIEDEHNDADSLDVCVSNFVKY